MPEELKEAVLKAYRDRYRGFGPTFAAEKILETEKARISEETLRRWLISAGEWKRRRKHRKHRQWRERKHYFGEMIQMDGSHHKWFEDRGPECVLMGYVDDASNTVFTRFYEYEGTIPALKSFKRYIRRYGVPQSVYLDKHSTYKSPGKRGIDDELNGRDSLSQFQRALGELGVEVIYANSPQAKGRIERVFRTFQDRLIKEQRLKGISTIKEGNKFLRRYLPGYNRQFSIRAIKGGDLHRRLSGSEDLNAILCIKAERFLRNDFTVAYQGKLYQIITRTGAKKVTVEERISGSIRITCRGKELKHRRINKRPVKKTPERVLFKARKVYVPPRDHPYKSFQISPYARKSTEVKQEKEPVRVPT